MFDIPMLFSLLLGKPCSWIVFRIVLLVRVKTVSQLTVELFLVAIYSKQLSSLFFEDDSGHLFLAIHCINGHEVHTRHGPYEWRLCLCFKRSL